MRFIMRFIIVVLLPLKLFSLTAEDIIKKYHLENPCYTKKEMDVSLCDELCDSTDYYYFRNTEKLDSTIEYAKLIVGDRVFRKSVFKYDTLKSGFLKELTITTEWDYNSSVVDTFDVETKLYNKQGLLIEEKSISTSIGEYTDKYTYNLKGQRIKFISYVNRRVWTDEDYYYNKKGLRHKIVYKKGVSDTTYNIYTPFDSLLATIELYKGKKVPYILNFYKNKKMYKKIMYSWARNVLPKNCTYYYYNSKGQLIKDITLAKSESNINETYKDKNTLTPQSWTIYRYDKQGRLKQKVTRQKPYEED